VVIIVIVVVGIAIPSTGIIITMASMGIAMGASTTITSIIVIKGY